MPRREWSAVFWDIGGVILDHESTRRGHERFIKNLSEQFDLEYDSALGTWRNELGRYFREREGTTYRVARAGYQEAITAAVGEELPDSAWFPLFREATDACLEPIDGAAPALARLHSNDYYLGVISDIDTWEAERILRNFGVREYFDDLTTSEAVGRTKPDSRIFTAALEKSPVPAEQGLMLGDRYRHDMRGGTDAGLSTVAVDGSAAEHAPTPTDGYRVDDPYVDFVVDSPRDILAILSLEH